MTHAMIHAAVPQTTAEQFAIVASYAIRLLISRPGTDTVELGSPSLFFSITFPKP